MARGRKPADKAPEGFTGPSAQQQEKKKRKPSDSVRIPKDLLASGLTIDKINSVLEIRKKAKRSKNKLLKLPLIQEYHEVMQDWARDAEEAVRNGTDIPKEPTKPGKDADEDEDDAPEGNDSK